MPPPSVKWFACALLIFPSVLCATDAMPSEKVMEFVDRHCATCHDEEEKKGGLDLGTLRFDVEARDAWTKWVKVFDRVETGEMPPREKRRPRAEELEEFLAELGGSLLKEERAVVQRDGRATQRRLNRYEYENVLRDLLGVPWVQVKDRLPQDGEAHRFNKIGDALDVSHIQMARYLSVADHAMRQAMSAKLEARPTAVVRYYARDEPSLTRNFWPREGGTLSDRLAFPVLDGKAQPDVRAGRAALSDPATREREAVGKVASTFSDAGGYVWANFRAPVGGKYRLRFSGYTIWVSGGGIARWFYDGTGEAKAPEYHATLWHRPNLEEIWPGRRHEPIGVYAASSGQRRPIGSFDFQPQEAVFEIEATLAPNETIQTDASRFFRTRVNGSDEQYVNPLATKDGMPGYAVQWMEVEGPIEEGSASAAEGYKLLFGDLPMERREGGKGAVWVDVVSQRKRGGGPGGFGLNVPMEKVAVEVVSENPREDAERLLRGFMSRAYRRPVEEADVQRMLRLFHEQFEGGAGFARSLLASYTAVLASPGFVFVEEKPGELDDYAVATRLALFLWNSEPDAALRARAARGELKDEAVLRQETERMLNDPKAARFVEAFTDYWLDLREFDDTSPSPTLYNDYELDDPLKHAALEETRLFVAELLRGDWPARNLVDSDFTFLNERLAAHYEVPGVSGVRMRKVALPEDSVRGGVMTQASVLKVTANGTTTSPVLRGHWITERILGYETPPPPPVPAVEPDIRGATTIRQQLEKHRADPSCASCHTRMDPPGFALESFDVMGGWRDNYRAVKEGVEPVKGVGMNGQAYAFHAALPVDASGELPDGRKFEDVREFKRLLLEDERTIARNLATQLTVYATGAPVRFSDRAEIEAILDRSQESGYGVRTMVWEIVRSGLFRRK